MKTFRIILIVILGSALLWGLGVVWSNHRTKVEHARMMDVASRVAEQLVSYKHEHHAYPASLDMLSFTNATVGLDMSDVRKLQYETTEAGFTLSYHSGQITSVFKQVSRIE